MSDNQPQQPPAVPTTANGHRERRPWTEDEDRLLREAIAREDPGANPPSKWHAIATHVPNRTNKDCRKRWWAQMATTVAKGGWSAEEDDRLCTAVDEFGTKWALVATRVQTRNSGQCAKRWNDALNPAIDRSEWTDEEDVKLLEAVKTQGKSWTNIVRQLLPGRTGLAAKNRYNHLTRASSDRAQARERRKTAAGPYARGGAASGAAPVSTSSATSVNGSPTSQLSRAHSPRTPPDGYVQPKTEDGQYYRPGDYPNNGAQAPQQPQQASDERPLSLPHAPYPPPPLAGYPYRVAQPNTPIDSPRSATAAYPPGPYFNHGGPPPAGVYHHSSQPPTPASALGPPGPPYFPSAPPPTGYDARAAAFEHQRRSMQPSPSSAHAYPPDQAGQYGHHPEYRGQQGQAPAGGYERRYDEGYESVPGVPMQPVANGMVNQSSW